MAIKDIPLIVERISKAGNHFVEGDSTQFTRSWVEAAVPWSPVSIETALSVSIPPDLSALWTIASRLYLHIDVKDRQWGLEIWGPDQVVSLHSEEVAAFDEDDLRDGDMLIGSFVGDTDLLVARCRQGSEDFGHIIVVPEGYHRKYWYRVSCDLAYFLSRHLDSPESKYWEDPGFTDFVGDS